MNSEVDSSIISPTLDTLETESKKSRKRSAHTTWAHTRTPQDQEPEYQGKNRLFYCKYCIDESYSTPASTSFRHHLLSKHEIRVEATPGPIQTAALEQLQQLYTRAMSLGQTQQLDSQVLQKNLNKDVINEALVSLIIVRNLPFRLVEWPEFHAFCRVLNPEIEGYITTAHSEVTKMIQRSWQGQKDIVRKKLQSALSSIHLSLDIWTSPNNLLLLGICAHFVEQSEEKLSKALLALRTVASHSGEEQFATLLPVLQDYGIVRKLGSIVSDNHTANDKLCRTISVHLLDDEGIAWDPIYRRIRCTGHVINLAVQAFLFQNLIELDQISSYEEEEARGEGDAVQRGNTFRAMGPLGKLHNIVVHIRSSAGRIQEFKDIAERMIPLDNRTRWNSWYEMLRVVIDQRVVAAAIDAYTKKHFDTLQSDYLSPKEWEKLRTICKFLQPFYRATLVTQGDQATIDHVLFTMDILIKHFEKALVSLLTSYRTTFTNFVR